MNLTQAIRVEREVFECLADLVEFRVKLLVRSSARISGSIHKCNHSGRNSAGRFCRKDGRETGSPSEPARDEFTAYCQLADSWMSLPAARAVGLCL
jgi:hypothetical protein